VRRVAFEMLKPLGGRQKLDVLAALKVGRGGGHEPALAAIVPGVATETSGEDGFVIRSADDFLLQPRKGPLALTVQHGHVDAEDPYQTIGLVFASGRLPPNIYGSRQSPSTTTTATDTNLIQSAQGGYGWGF